MRRLAAARRWTEGGSERTPAPGVRILKDPSGRRVVALFEPGGSRWRDPEDPDWAFLHRVLGAFAPYRRLGAGKLPDRPDCLLVAREGDPSLYLRCPEGEKPLCSRPHARTIEFEAAFEIPAADARALVRIGGSGQLRVYEDWVYSAGRRAVALYRMKGGTR